MARPGLRAARVVGFLDSFNTGLKSLGAGIGSFVESFSSSPTGGQFLGQLGEYGFGKLSDLIGLEPAAPQQQGFQFGSGTFDVFGPGPVGPLGQQIDPSRGAARLKVSSSTINSFEREIARIRSMDLNRQQQAFEDTIHVFGTQFLPHIPAARTVQQIQPGPVPVTFPGPFRPDFGGSPMAFPTTRGASFPAPSFLPALFGGGGGGFQTAGFPALAGGLVKQLPGIVGGFLGGAAIDAALTGGGGGTPMFRPTMAGARAQFFRAQNPATGQDTWFRPAGRPLLWSGDLTACKRVNKVARRAARKR